MPPTLGRRVLSLCRYCTALRLFLVRGDRVMDLGMLKRIVVTQRLRHSQGIDLLLWLFQYQPVVGMIFVLLVFVTCNILCDVNGGEGQVICRHYRPLI